MQNYKKILTNQKEIIPIFYACDDGYLKYTIVSIKSLTENANKDYLYKIFVLNTGVSASFEKELLNIKGENFSVELIDVKKQLEKIASKLPIRDYFSKTTYFRMFIADMFPEYDKAIYIDSDTVVLGDISKFYFNSLGNNLVGACQEIVMKETEVYGNYVEKVLGIDRNKYFNAGHLLINLKAFREEEILKKFIELLSLYTFKVTQDEDYLNVLCKDRVLWIDQSWNVEVYGKLSIKESDINVIHYIMTSKPWHYEDCKFGQYFWYYAKKTDVFGLILEELTNYTDEQKERDAIQGKNLEKLAIEEAKRIDTYVNLVSKKKALQDCVCLKKFAVMN